MGSASWAIIFGKARDFEDSAATRLRGGKSGPLCDEESVGCNAKCGVVVKTSPTPPLEMAEPDFLLQFEIVAFDAPAHFRRVHEMRERDGFIQCRKPKFRRRFFIFWPFDQQPFLGNRFCCRIAIMG